ncbi:hypothetical protein AOLI_G00314490 [Acnodon oligacanthus]
MINRFKEERGRRRENLLEQFLERSSSESFYSGSLWCRELLREPRPSLKRPPASSLISAINLLPLTCKYRPLCRMVSRLYCGQKEQKRAEGLTGRGCAVRGEKDSRETAADAGAKPRQSDSIRQALKGAAERRAAVPDQPFPNTALHISEKAIGALQPLNDPIQG